MLFRTMCGPYLVYDLVFRDGTLFVFIDYFFSNHAEDAHFSLPPFVAYNLINEDMWKSNPQIDNYWPSFNVDTYFQMTVGKHWP